MMLAPHSSCRYAVLATESLWAGEPTLYAVVAVHGLMGEDYLLVSNMKMGSPVTYEPPRIVARSTVKALCRNSADATALAHRLRTEDMEASR